MVRPRPLLGPVFLVLVVAGAVSLTVHGPIMAAHDPSMADHAWAAPMGDDPSLAQLMTLVSCVAIVTTAVARFVSRRPVIPGPRIVHTPVHHLALEARSPARPGRHPPDDGTVLRP